MKFKFTNSEKADEYYNETREIRKLLSTLNLENIDSHILKIIDDIEVSCEKNITAAKLVLLFENRFNLQDYYAKIIANLYLKHQSFDLIWLFSDFESQICTYIFKNMHVDKDTVLSIFSKIDNKDNIATNTILLNLISEYEMFPEFNNKYTDYCLSNNQYNLIFSTENLNYFFKIFIKNLDFHNLSLIYSKLYHETKDDFLLKYYELYQNLNKLFMNLSIKHSSDYLKEINDFRKFIKKNKFQDLEIFFTYFLNSDLELNSLEFGLDFVLSNKSNLSREKLEYLEELISIYSNGYDSIDSFSKVTYLNFIFKNLLSNLSEETLIKLTFYKHRFLTERIIISTDIVKELPSKQVLDILLPDLCSSKISPVIIKEKLSNYSYFKDIKSSNNFSKDFNYKNKSRCISLVLSLIDKLQNTLTFNITSFDFNNGKGILKINSENINFFYMQTINDKDIGISYLHIENSSNSINLETFSEFMRYYFLIKESKDIFLETKNNLYCDSKKIIIDTLSNHKFDISKLYCDELDYGIDFTDFFLKNNKTAPYLNNKIETSPNFSETQSLLLNIYDDVNFFSSFETNYCLIEQL
ncbi:MAG: hypothetical protein ACRDA0_09965 [Cetobacterium sp.]|uniref:hypothetical protein n=1 Tax=Cetobacterium sp. TaxID=2071632 RepID=UPI003F396E5B